jgi:hypothetical protein
MRRHPIGSALLWLLALLLSAGTASAAATLTIVNVDGPGEGFNDPTVAVEPAPGNPGITVGEQRLAAFEYAAALWGAVLDSPVEILVRAAFNPLTCTATGAVLGSAGTTFIFRDFDGAEIAETWYHSALADKLAGEDLNPGQPDLNAQFNSNLGQPTCLAASGWYYGLDAAQPANRINLVAVLLHEFGHGLGFANFVNEVTGSFSGGFGDIYSEYTFDVETGKFWNDMTAGLEIRTSAINSRKVVWTGINVTADLENVLTPGTPLMTVDSPASIAGVYDVGAASFGPPLSDPGLTGTLVQALDPADAAGPTATDACSPITNGAEVAGNIALVDRGTCGFVVKVKNCQDAGAIAVVVADNAVGAPPAGLGGADPTIVIPAVRITLDDGNLIKPELAGGVVVTLGVDPDVLAGTEATTGLAHLNAPNPVQSGSSISHWDPIAFRNLLMEPAINVDLTHSLQPPEDLTLNEMVDIGWFSDGDGVPDGVDQCIGSDPSATVVIDGCDSGVDNHVFETGCRFSDAIEDCAAAAGNQGDFVSCVSHVTNDWKKAKLITGAQKDAITDCAADADIP